MVIITTPACDLSMAKQPIPAADADYVRDLMEDCLTQAFKDFIPEMLFAIEARIADCWRS
jgi:hypothetical protein